MLLQLMLLQFKVKEKYSVEYIVNKIYVNKSK